MSARVLRDERGYTLAELLVAAAVIGLILGGMLLLQQQGQAAYLLGAARVEVQQNARVALDLMLNELRSAASITTVTGCDNASTGTSDVTFADQSSVTVRYRKNGTDLERTYGGTMTVLIGGVQALSVWCYTSDGVTLTATPGSVKSLTISISTQTESGAAARSAGDQHALLRSQVTLKNIP